MLSCLVWPCGVDRSGRRSSPNFSGEPPCPQQLSVGVGAVLGLGGRNALDAPLLKNTPWSPKLRISLRGTLGKRPKRRGVPLRGLVVRALGGGLDADADAERAGVASPNCAANQTQLARHAPSSLCRLLLHRSILCFIMLVRPCTHTTRHHDHAPTMPPTAKLAAGARNARGVGCCGVVLMWSLSLDQPPAPS